MYTLHKYVDVCQRDIMLRVSAPSNLVDNTEENVTAFVSLWKECVVGTEFTHHFQLVFEGVVIDAV